MKILVLFSFIFTFSFVFGQSNHDGLLKTEAIIQKIEYKPSKRYTKEFAHISYTTKDGLKQKSYIEIARLPIVGSFKNVGDKIEIYYDPNNPAFAVSKTGNFLNHYGMYILIFLGIIFSTRSILKAFKKT